MTLVLEEMAVQFSAQGEQQVTAALKQIDAGTAAARTEIAGLAETASTSMARTERSFRHTAEVIEEESEVMGVSTEHLTHRMEHLGMQGAFAFTMLAEGSERGLQRFAHGVAALGFMFGGMAGAITTFVAIAGEQFLSWLNEAKKEADETAKKVEENWQQLGEGGNLMATIRRQQQLMFGDPFASKDVFGEMNEAVRTGGIQALRLRKEMYEKLLEQTVEAAGGQAKMDKIIASGGITSARAADATVFAQYRERQKVITDTEKQLEELSAAYSKVTSLASSQAEKFSAAEKQKFDQEQARKRAAEAIQIQAINLTRGLSDAKLLQREEEADIDRQHVAGAESRYTLEVAAAQKAHDTEMRLLDAALARAQKDSPEYAELLSKRAEVEASLRSSLLSAADQYDAAVKARTVAAHESEMLAAKGDFDERITMAQEWLWFVSNAYADDVALNAEAQRQLTEAVTAGNTDRKKNADSYFKFLQDLDAAGEKLDEARNKQMVKNAGETADLIAGAFTALAAPQGGIQKFGDFFLQELGAFFREVGQSLITGGSLLSAAKAALTSLFGAGPGLIVAGIGLVALGSILGARGGGGGGSVTPAASASSASTTSSYTGVVAPDNPRTPATTTAAGGARVPQVYNISLFGKNDPQLQTDFLEIMALAKRRGTSNGG